MAGPVSTPRANPGRPPASLWDAPLGWSPESQEALQRWGVYPRHDGSLLDPLRMVNQSLLDPIAIAGDVAMRAPVAATELLGDAAGGIHRGLGGSESDANRTSRETQNLLTALSTMADGSIPGVAATPGKAANLLDVARNDYAPGFRAMLADESGSVPRRPGGEKTPTAPPYTDSEYFRLRLELHDQARLLQGTIESRDLQARALRAAIDVPNHELPSVAERFGFDPKKLLERRKNPW